MPVRFHRLYRYVHFSNQLPACSCAVNIIKLSYSLTKPSKSLFFKKQGYQFDKNFWKVDP